MGYKTCLLVFAVIFSVGQIIFTIGLMLKSWPLLFVGRFIFGFGADAFMVGNSALISVWFKGKELAFSFAINLSISRIGSVLNNIVSPQLANNLGIVFASWFAVILCGFGMMTIFFVYPIDRHVEALIEENSKYNEPLREVLDNGNDDVLVRRDSKTPEEEPIIVMEERSSFTSIDLTTPRTATGATRRHHNRRSGSRSDYDHDPLLDQEPTSTFKDVLSLPKIFWVLVVSCVVIYGCVLPFNFISSSLLLERDYFKEPPSSCRIENPNYCENDLSNPYLSCPTSKWYQPPLPNNITNEYNPLSTSDIDCTDDYWKDNCATSLYCSRLIAAETQASFVMSIPFIMSAALSPPTGFLVDMFGMRAVFATLAPAVLVVVHCFLGLTNVSAVGPLVGQGFGYTAFVSVLWPSIPLVVETRLTGLAFGIVFSLHNLGLTTIPLIIAAIYKDSDDHYIPNVEFLFIGLASVGVLVGLYLNYYDYTHGGVLNSPQKLADEKKKKMVKDGYSEVNDADSREDEQKVIVFKNEGKKSLIE
jgi:MFS family permease